MPGDGSGTPRVCRAVGWWPGGRPRAAAGDAGGVSHAPAPAPGPGPGPVCRLQYAPGVRLSLPQSEGALGVFQRGVGSERGVGFSEGEGRLSEESVS